MGLEKERRVEQDYDSLAFTQTEPKDVYEVEEGTDKESG